MNILQKLELSALNALDFARNQFEPRLRLGVTGLSRSGKTVFITALVKALLEGGRLPMFEAQATGRITRVTLQPQPDDKVPRFEIEAHMAQLNAGENRAFPQSTRHISELRLLIEYVTKQGAAKKLTLDIVDYPGEWLLDLPLLAQDYATWSKNALAQAKTRGASDYLTAVAKINESAPADELEAKLLANLYKDYLQRCRDEEHALSALPPGRFLMAGDLEGSPALTFAPLFEGASALHTLMAKRFEAYKTHVIFPFFKDHFARLDRQIVLIDALAALNANKEAVDDLQKALVDILSSLNMSKNSFFTHIFSKSIEKTVIAATKADHIHSSQHERLQNLVTHIVQSAVLNAKANGATVQPLAIASVRASREARVSDHDCIIATPQKGQKGFDGDKEIAIYAGELPQNPQDLIAGGDEFRFLKLRPPLTLHEQGAFPHIRLDRAMEALLGDYLR